jgi:uncharacterized membrane protein
MVNSNESAVQPDPSMIPIIGWILLPFAYLAILVFAIIGIMNAANGRNKPLPLIGGISILR